MLWQLWDWVVHRSASKPVLRAVCSNYTLLTILLATFNMKNSWVMIFNRWQWWSLNFSFMICEKLYESQTATWCFVWVLSWSSIWNLPWSVLVLALQSTLDFQTKWDLKIILLVAETLGLATLLNFLITHTKDLEETDFILNDSLFTSCNNSWYSMLT